MEKYYLDVEHFHSLQAQNQSTVAWWECWSTCRKSGGSSWRKRGFWRTSSAERKWRGHNHYVFFGISTSLFQTTSKLIWVQSYWSIRLAPSYIEFQRGKLLRQFNEIFCKLRFDGIFTFVQMFLLLNSWKSYCAIHSVEKRKFWSHQKNISSKQLFSHVFSETVNFTKFLPKMCETKSQQFPHCAIL